MKPIAIFYHCLFELGDPPQMLPQAIGIIHEQMTQLRLSGLLDTAKKFVVGINGWNESLEMSHLVIPPKAEIILHGLDSRAENLTIVELWKWAKSNPGWNILYFHSKGATHAVGSDYGDKVSNPWREGMMADLIVNWRKCIPDLNHHDIVCSHWMWNLADGSQHIPAGNFLWITSDFAARLPDIHLRERIKMSGIGGLESRFEAEVFWGNGPRPNVKSFRPNGGGGVP